MSARLICRTGELSGVVHEVTEECVMGRDPQSQLVLPSDVVSARHARIYAEGGTFYLEDLESRNGTTVDGMVVSQPIRLGRLNVINIAQTFDLVFYDPWVTADGQPSEAQIPRASQQPPGQPDEGMMTIAMPFDVSVVLPDLQSPTGPDDQAEDPDASDR